MWVEKLKSVVKKPAILVFAPPALETPPAEGPRARPAPARHPQFSQRRGRSVFFPAAAAGASWFRAARARGRRRMCGGVFQSVACALWLVFARRFGGWGVCARDLARRP